MDDALYVANVESPSPQKGRNVDKRVWRRPGDRNGNEAISNLDRGQPLFHKYCVV
jgi:hypothetical protein